MEINEVPVTEDVVEESTATEKVTDTAPDVEESTQQTEDTGLEVPELTGKTESDFAVPDEYKERGWTKNVKSIDGLWKIANDAQSLIGKKQLGEFNPAEATEEQMEAFYNKVRPEDKSGYEFPEGTVDDEKELLSSTFFENGLSSKQASDVMSKYRGYMEGKIKEAYSPEVFTSSIKSMFGDNAQQELNEVTDLMNKNINADIVSKINNAPSDLKASIYGALSAIKQAYGANEGGVSDSNMSSEQGMSNPQDAYNQAMKDREALSRRPHTQEEADAVVNRINQALRAMSK